MITISFFSIFRFFLFIISVIVLFGEDKSSQDIQKDIDANNIEEIDKSIENAKKINNKPSLIPKIKPKTDDEKRRYERAKSRHLKRRKKRIK